ncbi:MAG: hypothetical protein K0U78_14615 [Actinomycetia bacterium]|nr:hypothetical protein [Actinomycetes bacterium]
MIDIDGLTQIEIEELFSQENLNEYISIELAVFLEQMEQEHYDILATHVDTPIETMMKLIAFFGDAKIGHQLDTGERVIELEYAMSFVSTLFKEDEYNNRMQRAIDLIADFDTILYDLQQSVRMSDDGGYYTETSLIVGFSIGKDTKINEYTNLVRFRLPLIEEPLAHTEKSSGGYHLDSGKVVLNRGEQNQPQECLDVLNKLQCNAYTLNEVSYTDERLLIMDKLQSNNWKNPNKSDIQLLEDNEAKCDTIMLTTHETYKTMENKKFYFAWKFDMRGRMYSIGYDLNLQATSYKKASLKAI